MTAHTPTPWALHSVMLTHVVDAADREFVADCNGTNDCSPLDEANAARIVACVNFCEGMPDASLTETGGCQRSIEFLAQTIREVECQREHARTERDDLLSALQRLTHPAADDSDLQDALELIAKTTGGK